jgi:pyrroline-5-carboxylate reductase
MTKICIIGAGKMGTAIGKALSSYTIQMCDKGDKPEDAEVYILSVKPQDFPDAMHEHQLDLSDKLVISIMAGVSLERLQSESGSSKVVRSMPNLPLQVGQGFTAWIASSKFPEKTLARDIIACFGRELEVQDEAQLDSITALSGSGPAYFFALTELLSDKAQALGFNEEEAETIANQTFIGAAKLMEANNKSAQEWREAVTSKGGTTAAALNHLHEQKWDKIFYDAVEAARLRSQELNQ